MLEELLHRSSPIRYRSLDTGSYHAPAQRLIRAGQQCSESELTVTRKKGGRVYLRRLEVTLKPSSWLLSREELPRTVDSFSKNGRTLQSILV